MADKKIGLCIVGYKGYLFLKKILDENNENIVFVNSYKNYGDLIKKLAETNSIKYLEDKTLTKLPEADIIFFVGWQYMVKPNDKYLILHDSYLPENKGFCPTVNSLIRGDDHLGATAFRPTNKLDSGPIHVKISIPIQYPIKIVNALRLVVDAYIKLYKHIIYNPVDIPLTDYNESFSIWRDELDYFIDWNKDAEHIKRMIDALGIPYDGAKTWAPHLIKINECKVIKMNFCSQIDHTGKIWSLENDEPIVVCGKNALKILHYNGSRITKLRTRLGVQK